MPTAAQILSKSATPYQNLVRRLTDAFPACDDISPCDVPTLTDDDLAVILNHESGVGIDACEPAHWAEIFNSAVYVTKAEKDAALARIIRTALMREARNFLYSDINAELLRRNEPRSRDFGVASELFL